MCGIAGYRNLSSSSFTVDTALLEAMQSSMSHRGPDGYRTWQSERHEIGLVHRRLSIMDLSNAAFQPMIDEQQTVAVICNGEIYNHPQLRKELESRGHVYRTNSDTETIVHAYKEWGIGCISKLEGMFAIVILDMKTGELFLVRDRIGIKPLYFSLQGGILSFASEIKALWQLPWNTRRLNPLATYHYLTYLATPAPMTLFEGVYKLPASYYIKVDPYKNVSYHAWYTPIVTATEEEKALFSDERYCIDNIRSLLRASVKQQMMSDVSMGVFLSGGIDSSLNVALMSELAGQVKTFNVSFSDGPEYKETQWARLVAKKFGTDHHEIEINEQDAFNFFEKMVYHQDEPIGDCVCVPLYYVSDLLRRSGVTVVQVGEGSDELFCGYSLYAQYLKMNNYWETTQKYVPAFARRGLHHVASKLYPTKLNRLDMLENWSKDRMLFWSGAVVFNESWKQKIMPAHRIHAVDPVVQQISGGFAQDFDSHSVADFHRQKLMFMDPDADFLKQMTYLELKHRLPELLLMRVDKMTMATSVEARVPFLDHKLVEFALQIPTSLKYKDGQTKYILKKACEGILPDSIIYRKKIGFAAPTSRWFAQGRLFNPHLRDMLSARKSTWNSVFDYATIARMLDDHQAHKADYSAQLWALQNIMAIDVGF